MPDEQARFWVYAQEHVVGPYGVDELPRLPIFGPDLPLCPERLLGTIEERWRRAADTAGISEMFPPPMRTPEGAEAPKVGPWPPDPEKEAVDPLGTAQARMDIIDRSLEATQGRLNLRREAYERLKRELAARVAQAAQLEETMRTLGRRMAGYMWFKDEVDQAKAALVMSHKRASDLEEHLGRVETQLKDAAALAAAAGTAASAAGTAAAQAAEEAKKRPPEAPPRRTSPPAAAEPKGRKRRSRRTSGGGPDALGLPPATSVDVPDFT